MILAVLTEGEKAVTMQWNRGARPPPGVSSRRPRPVVLQRPCSLNGESVLVAQNVAGEGASHNARGGRAPLPLHSYGLESRSAIHSTVIVVCRRSRAAVRTFWGSLLGRPGRS